MILFIVAMDTQAYADHMQNYAGFNPEIFRTSANLGGEWGLCWQHKMRMHEIY